MTEERGPKLTVGRMIGWESFIDKLTSEYSFEGWLGDKRDGRYVGVNL